VRAPHGAGDRRARPALGGGLLALLAPILLLTADVIGRVVISPSELEVGVVTALIGAPVFIALVRRKRIAQL
jgi:iron complex transport system permease protein